MPTTSDNILSKDRAVFFICLMFGYKLKFREIITDKIKIWWEIITNEVKIRAKKFDTSYPFPCLITGLCKVTYVPILTEVDNKVEAIKHIILID